MHLMQLNVLSEPRNEVGSNSLLKIGHHAKISTLSRADLQKLRTTERTTNFNSLNATGFIQRISVYYNIQPLAYSHFLFSLYIIP